MNKNANGEYQRAKSYIARKEDFQKAITDQGNLRVIAIYPDGQTGFTQLLGYITETRLTSGYTWEVKTSEMKPGHFVSVTIQ